VSGRSGGLAAHWPLVPIAGRRESESRSDQFGAFGVVLPPLLARADGGMVPVVDAVAVEIGLANLGPVLGRVGRRVGVFPQPLAHSAAVGLHQPLAPAGVDAA